MRNLPLIAASFLLAVFLAFHTSSVSATSTVTYTCPTLGSATATTVYGNLCYAYYTTALSWSDAKIACASIGGKLATIKNAGADAAIASIALTDSWFGAADNNSLISGSSEGNYYWIDGYPFWTGGQAGSAVGGAYTNWETGEPNNLGGENCLLKYSSNGKWNDYGCGNGRHYVCEIAADQNAVNVNNATSQGEQGAGGLRSASLQMRINGSSRGKHPAAPSSSARSISSIAPMGNVVNPADAECRRMKFSSLPPMKQKVVNTMILKKFGRGCTALN